MTKPAATPPPPISDAELEVASKIMTGLLAQAMVRRIREDAEFINVMNDYSIVAGNVGVALTMLGDANEAFPVSAQEMRYKLTALSSSLFTGDFDLDAWAEVEGICDTCGKWGESCEGHGA